MSDIVAPRLSGSVLERALVACALSGRVDATGELAESADDVAVIAAANRLVVERALARLRVDPRAGPTGERAADALRALLRRLEQDGPAEADVVGA